MKLLMENWRRFLAEEEQVAFAGILKIIPSSAMVESLRAHLTLLPEGAVPLPDEKFHVTLVHQSVLKPYRSQLKGAAFPPAPDVKLSQKLVEAVDGDRKSWAVLLENQEEMSSYVNQIMEMVGAEPNPEPDRRFHITIANLTGKTSDSVALVERDFQKESERIKDHSRRKKELLDSGPNDDEGGGEGHQKTNFKRGESAPPVAEAISLDIEVGDVLLGGKYKNKRIVVKEIGTDELGQPTINGKPLLKVRIEKHLPDEKKSKKTKDSEKNTGEE